MADELVDEERVARGALMDLSGQHGASPQHGRDLALVQAGHRHDRHYVLLMQISQDRGERVSGADLTIAAGGHDQHGAWSVWRIRWRSSASVELSAHCRSSISNTTGAARDSAASA